MSKKSYTLSSKKMVVTSKGRNKTKVISCPTPDLEFDSPSRDSDSLCDSEAASPVPFLCTQDGAEGETDVVWNYYTPKADSTATSRIKNSTPLSRKERRLIKKIPIEKPIQKRRNLRSTQKKTELFQDLIELNQNLHKLMEKRNVNNSDKQSGSEEDIFSNSSDCSPKSILKSNTRCLRKNLLSSKFSKPEMDTALESDDSMNECLIKASQIVEDKIMKPSDKFTDTSIFQDTMDNILYNIKLETPRLQRTKTTESPKINNDSFDSFVGNLNDSALERLTQLPVKTVTPVRTKSKPSNSTSEWELQDMRLHESPSSKSIFGRHNSMPESPTVVECNMPSTSGMLFGRYNSMPHNEKDIAPGDSPIRCTPDEIRKKHLQAREKLLAKRLLPFTASQTTAENTQVLPQSLSASLPKRPCFQPKVPSSKSDINLNSQIQKTKQPNTEIDIKKLIEKKRQEALMKLRKKQSR